MSTKRQKIVALSAILASLLGLTACGPNTANHATLDPVSVKVATSAALAQIPLELAQDLGFFRQQGIAVTSSPAADASITIANAGQHWPIVAAIGQGADGFVVGPRADPGFRLAALTDVPIAYPAHDQSLAVLVTAVMTLHGLPKPMLDPLSVKQITRLWRNRHVPYLVANASLWHELLAIDPKAKPLAVLSASTGPIPDWVIYSHSKDLPAFLAAVNLSLWYISTHTPASIVDALSPSQRHPDTRWLITLAERYQWYSPSTVIPKTRYERGQRFWALTGITWPHYIRAVDSAPAVTALSITP